jgi:hypothetical protein
MHWSGLSLLTGKCPLHNGHVSFVPSHCHDTQTPSQPSHSCMMGGSGTHPGDAPLAETMCTVQRQAGPAHDPPADSAFELFHQRQTTAHLTTSGVSKVLTTCDVDFKHTAHRDQRTPHHLLLLLLLLLLCPRVPPCARACVGVAASNAGIAGRGASCRMMGEAARAACATPSCPCECISSPPVTPPTPCRLMWRCCHAPPPATIAAGGPTTILLCWI